MMVPSLDTLISVAFLCLYFLFIYFFVFNMGFLYEKAFCTVQWKLTSILQRKLHAD